VPASVAVRVLSWSFSPINVHGNSLGTKDPLFFGRSLWCVRWCASSGLDAVVLGLECDAVAFSKSSFVGFIALSSPLTWRVSAASASAASASATAWVVASGI
jgi:hypothetical protein